MKNYEFDYTAVVPRNTKEFISYAIRPYRLKIAGFLSTTFLGVLAWQAAPYIISLIIDRLATIGLVDNTVWLLAFFYGICVFLNEIFWRVSEIWQRSYSPQMTERIRTTLFSALTKRNHKYFVDSSSGQVSYWINNATSTFDSVVRTTAWNVWGNFLTLLISAAFLLLAHWSLALLFTVWLIGLFLFSSKRGKTYGKLNEAMSSEVSKASGRVVDTVSNNIPVRIFEGRSTELDGIEFQQQSIIRARRKAMFYHTKTNAVKGQSSVVASIIAICLTLYLYSQGTVQLGDVVLFIAYFSSAGAVLWDLAWAVDTYYSDFGTIQEALTGLKGEDERSSEERVSSESTALAASLSVSDLSFSYPEQPGELVLNRLNLDILAGEKVGVVGHSGAGKSTLIGLLLGFYDPKSGSISINGVDTTTKDPSFVRSMSSLVPQDTNLFNRTIRENILYARPSANEEELVEALKKAEAYEFVMKLTDGLDTLVGERGVKLSGGQRQRIAIARAILRDAPLLLLDEATSALDSVSEQAIQKALHKLMKGRTAVVIAHRLSTLKHLDKIVVMDKGSIAEQGTHEELLKSGGIYADLWKRQKDGFLVE